MAKKFAELEAGMSSESITRSDAKAKRLKEEMALNELRAALEITQEQLARLLDVNQAAVSKLERRMDTYVSTLASVIRAMGGELEIHAKFPEGRVKISQFRDLTRGRTRTASGD
jgi:DNA-binding XRE family transcriptional regulator